MNIRTGDIVISKHGIAYEVEDIGLQSVDCFEIDHPSRHKSFDHGDLSCVDADDGLWQEMEERGTLWENQGHKISAHSRGGSKPK